MRTLIKALRRDGNQKDIPVRLVMGIIGIRCHQLAREMLIEMNSKTAFQEAAWNLINALLRVTCLFSDTQLYVLVPFMKTQVSSKEVNFGKNCLLIQFRRRDWDNRPNYSAALMSLTYSMRARSSCFQTSRRADITSRKTLQRKNKNLFVVMNHESNKNLIYTVLKPAARTFFRSHLQ